LASRSAFSSDLIFSGRGTTSPKPSPGGPDLRGGVA